MAYRSLMVLMAAFTTACGGPTVPDEPAQVDGEIVAVGLDVGTRYSDETLLTKVWVKERLDVPCGLVHFVRRDTELLATTGGETRAGRIGDLQVGARVRVWFDGPVADSCPGLAGADVIEVLRK